MYKFDTLKALKQVMQWENFCSFKVYQLGIHSPMSVH